MTHYLRFQSAVPNRRGAFPGVFAMANGLAREGRLSAADAEQHRLRNAQAESAYTDPSTVNVAVYDPERNPGARSWFREDATGLLEATVWYLDLLDRYGVPWVQLRTRTPGLIVYEDAVQVVAVPFGQDDWPFAVPPAGSAEG